MTGRVPTFIDRILAMRWWERVLIAAAIVIVAFIVLWILSGIPGG
jgi:hypothetical protein